jgi:hypothetical protein
MSLNKAATAIFCLIVLYSIGATLLIQWHNEKALVEHKKIIRLQQQNEKLEYENELYRLMTNNI